MIKKLMLKGKLVEKNFTYEKCAKALGISRTAFSNKMRGKSPFKVEEVNTLTKLIGLSQLEITKIFFE